MAQVAQALQTAGIRHVLVGSMSSNVHGFARSTKDMDLVVESNRAELDRLFNRLSDSFDVDPQISFETVTGTLRHILVAKDGRFKVRISTGITSATGQASTARVPNWTKSVPVSLRLTDSLRRFGELRRVEG